MIRALFVARINEGRLALERNEDTKDKISSLHETDNSPLKGDKK